MYSLLGLADNETTMASTKARRAFPQSQPSRAAPRTPLESPCFGARNSVLTRSEKT
jgi:hypothetical protein